MLPSHVALIDATTAVRFALVSAMDNLQSWQSGHGQFPPHWVINCVALSAADVEASKNVGWWTELSFVIFHMGLCVMQRL